MPDDVLQLADLGRSFGGSPVLAGVTLALAAGERLAVLGPSGSGKTTLLRLIAGLDAPTAGTVTLDGRPASGPGAVLIPPERRGVALVFQGLALFPHLRALDQVAFAAARGPAGRALARALLDRVGLDHRAGARLDELSGGERQRVALARALAQRPRLLLMDEPFASLDDDRRAGMRDLLRDLIDPARTALVIVTHSRDDALDLAGRVLVLDRGRPAAAGPLADVVRRPGHAAAARALGLGQVIDGAPVPGDPAAVDTAFGRVRVDPAETADPAGPAAHAAPPAAAPPVRVLVRPGQPHLVDPGDDAPGVDAEVIAVELRPSAGREPRRTLLVRAAGWQLRVALPDGASAQAGDRVRVRIAGPCEALDG